MIQTSTAKSSDTDILDEDDLGRYTVPALERGLQVLMQFNAHTPQLSAPEIAKSLGIPRSTVFRLIQTLLGLGFLERGSDENSYRLSIGVLKLGYDYLSSLSLTEQSQPILNALRDHCGFTSNLVIRDQTDVIFVARAASLGNIFSMGSVSIGTRLPAHATVLGRIALGDCSLTDLQKLYVEKNLASFTQHTLTNVEDLYIKVQEDLKRGYAVSESLFEVGISVIAAPVRDAQHKICGVLSITIPASKIEMTNQANLIGLVCHAATDLSRQLSFQA
ncbi:transcriptional regulator for the rhm operon [Gammaproteobacteria bacterium]|nr:transcriptional regulator for the rhm operon [Gammaproteobacteria bacterium]